MLPTAEPGTTHDVVRADQLRGGGLDLVMAPVGLEGCGRASFAEAAAQAYDRVVGAEMSRDAIGEPECG
jgi:hypothetical protein